VDDDYASSAPPEVTISPADNGHVVRWHQRSGKKGESGRSVTRVASSKEEALGHADEALGGGGSTKSSKKRSITRDGQSGAGSDPAAEGESGSTSSPAAHHRSSRNLTRSARRRRSRIGGRRA
jgi:hypothetical protein